MAGPPPIRPGDRVEVRVGDAQDRAAVVALVPQFGAHLAARGGDVLVSDEWTAEHDPHVQRTRSNGGRVTTLAGLIIARHDGPWVGVTGTAGKSSACHALAHILRASGRDVRMSATARSGNAWPDWSLTHDEATPGSVLVAELTSTHLCHMDTPLAPDVAVVTTIRPDHPDLHPTHAAYVAAKARLVPPAAAPGALVLPADDPATINALPAGITPDVAFGAGAWDAPGAYLTGTHAVTLRAHGRTATAQAADGSDARMRALLAGAAAALALGTDPALVAAALETVRAAPHRQHLVGRFRDAWIVDDTLAATPRKAMAAVRHYADRHPVLVLGGEPVAHPEGDLESALAEIAALGMRVVTFGPVAPQIAAGVTPVASAPTVMGALATAATIAGADGLVLVSPMFAMPPAERERVAALPQP